MAVSGLEILRVSEGWRWWQFDFSRSNRISIDGDSFLQRSLRLMGETKFPDLAWLGGGGPGGDGDGAAGFPGGVGLCPACAHSCVGDGHGAKAEGLLASSTMTRQIPVLPQAKESSLDDGSPEALHHLADDESSASPCVVAVSAAFSILLMMIEGLTTTVQDFTASPSRFSINNPILLESFETFVDAGMHCPRSCNFNLQAASSLTILVVSARQKISYSLSNPPLLKVGCSSNLPSCLFPNRRNHAGFIIRVELELPMQPWLTGLLSELLRFNDELRGNPLLSPVMLTLKSTAQQQTSLCRFHGGSR